MRSGYELFSVGGVAVKIHGSFLLLSGVMVLLAVSAGGSGADVGLRILGPLVLFATVIFHELGHAAAARFLGVRVIDVILTPMGGMARIEGELRNPKEEGLIAIAGPAMNVILAALTYTVIAVLGRSDEVVFERIIFFLEERRSFLQDDLLIVFFGLNVLLACLNLIPAFPCDGGRVLRAILSAKIGRLRGTRVACKVGFYFAGFLIVLPLFTTGQQWWITPFIGFYFLFTSIKERLSVEAREGLGLSGGFFQFGQQFGNPPPSPFENDTSGPEVMPRDVQIDDENIIDVTGTSRIVDEQND